MILDKSGLPNIGLALIRNNLGKLTPPKRVELKRRGEIQVLSIEGPGETYESESFGWGDASERVRAMSRALELVGFPTSFEDLRKAGPSQEHQIK